MFPSLEPCGSSSKMDKKGQNQPPRRFRQPSLLLISAPVENSVRFCPEEWLAQSINDDHGRLLHGEIPIACVSPLDQLFRPPRPVWITIQHHTCFPFLAPLFPFGDHLPLRRREESRFRTRHALPPFSICLFTSQPLLRDTKGLPQDDIRRTVGFIGRETLIRQLPAHGLTHVCSLKLSAGNNT